MEVASESIPQEWRDWKTAYQVHTGCDNEPDVVISADPVPAAECYSERVLWRSLVRANVLDGDLELPGAMGRFQKKGGVLKGAFRVDRDDCEALASLILIGLDVYLDASGIVLHSSGVFRDGHVWLFSGPSGSGKSTIASTLAGDGEKFSEDATIVRFNNLGGVVAARTPFRDDRADVQVPQTAPVAGIVFIQQADKTDVMDMSKVDIVQNLYYQSRHFDRDVYANQRFLVFAHQIANKRLCCKMAFQRDARFWVMLDGWRRTKLDVNK